VAADEYLKIIRQGVAAWNDWRLKNRELWRPDLSEADLRRADLRGADLSGTDLREADLRGANLRGADLSGALLRGADLRRAALNGADLREADLKEAYLDNASLCKAKLQRADLSGANLFAAHLSGADLCEATLHGANLTRAVLSQANLSGAKLDGAQLIRTDLCNAILTGSSVYGVSVWDIQLNEHTKQQNLIITGRGEPIITVDNIKVAQFIYMLLNNQEIREVIDTITSKAVLILGRFSLERKPVLDALRNALRSRGFLPIIFDFECPTGRDFTETIMTLAGMSSFVIADITNPKSAPLELQATVPNFMIPFVPILQDGEPAFSMFSNLQTKYHWVLDVLGYNSADTLVEVLDGAVINPALKKRDDLEQEKMRDRRTRHVDDYRKRPRSESTLEGYAPS
jgi:uncharacterized protein YjbI with pentapeptide repeats